MNGLAGTIRLEARGLGREFGRLKAVDGLDLSVEAGRVVALLGPNGAGKTTLLRLLMGLLEPTAGASHVLGVLSRSMPGHVAGRVSAMIEGHDPPGWAKLGATVSLQAAASARFDRAMARRLLDERELSPRQRFGRLSKGQKRWVLAALALAARPDVMILDEPADGLDPAARVSLYHHLRDHVTETGAAVLLATHLIADVQPLADDIAIMDRGRLALFAALEDLRDQVREVDLPGTPDEAGSLIEADSCEVLARAGGSAWVRVGADHDADAFLEQRLVGGAVVRPLHLESLYLAMTNSRSIDNGERSEKQEEPTCV